MKALSKYTEDKQTALMEELGAFFAFGNRQFDVKKKEGIKYVSLGAGLVCPKENADKLYLGFMEIQELGIKQRIDEMGIEAIIKYELGNYECWYTGDVTPAIEALKQYGVTQEDVLAVYRKYYAQEMANLEHNNY